MTRSTGPWSQAAKRAAGTRRDQAPVQRRAAREAAPVPNPERLQKIMAAAGVGSRRTVEKFIGAGSVLVNNKPAELGRSVAAGDRIRFGQREWLVTAEPERHRTLIYNKQEGEVTTRSDPDGRPTVFDHLPPLRNARWIAIGRLDINTTGLLLLTTDGELAHAMMHPSKRVDREYVCRIRGQVSEEQITRLKEGVNLADGPAHFNDIERAGSSGSNQWFKVTLLEGRNREVRRLWQSQGLMVSRLKRVRYGAAVLPKRLRMGQWAPVKPADYRVLREDVGLTPGVQELTLQPATSRHPPRHGAPRRQQPKPRSKRESRPGAKPGSPAGAGRRPHPRSRSARDT